jgi:hypothetical protein
LVLAAVRERLGDSESIRYLLGRVEEEVRRIAAGVSEELRLKDLALTREEKRLLNLVEFVADGRGSRALEDAIAETEKRLGALRTEVDVLKRGREIAFSTPPVSWIEKRVEQLRELLEARTEKSALLLRRVLGPVRLTPEATPVQKTLPEGRNDT